MNDEQWLAENFEEKRNHLQAVAFRMLGSLSEADDAVQEAWLRFSRAGTEGVENIGGWLTTIVARICLDMLRSRKSRREDSLEEQVVEPVVSRQSEIDPEYEAMLADSVGLALLVVLETLPPAERLAFVLHDLFDLPFDEIALIVDRSPTAARQLASRARRRVRGADMVADSDHTRQREVVNAFLAASRGGNFDALLAILDPDVVLRTDQTGVPREIRGAVVVANRAAKGGARATQPALVNGSVGVIVAPRGQLLMVIEFTITDGKIVHMEAIANPERLAKLDLAILDD